MRKCESAKVNMHKMMRKVLHFICHLSQSIFHTFALPKKREFINSNPQSATTKPSGFCYFVCYLTE